MNMKDMDIGESKSCGCLSGAFGQVWRAERNAIAERMRKNGFTEEQIKLALGDEETSFNFDCESQ